MKIINTLAELKTYRSQLTGKVALVPTMGNLHEGHLSLIKKANELADHVIVSIFVNPLQFAPHEDFDTYPRTLNSDCEKLTTLNVDAVFAPSIEEIYPQGKDDCTQVYVPELGKILCGESRPHFFQGVTTIVNKLFNLVKPNMAIFGQKDYQQFIIIKKMVADLHMDIDIISMPIVRESDGLAMSSRNQYLSAEQRQQASELYKQLKILASLIKEQPANKDNLINTAKDALITHGFKPDYIEVRQTDLSTFADNSPSFVVLAAAWLGQTRLIDNIIHLHQ